MFPHITLHRVDTTRFPRVRGDVPIKPCRVAHQMLFSPRARGCSGEWWLRCARPGVFPACAGMFLKRVHDTIIDGSFPRVRGDVPYGHPQNPRGQWFSPRARGCSVG